MPSIVYLQRLRSRLAGLGAALRRRSEFTCGDCERSNRCGSPPSATCIVRAEHLARDDWKRKRRIGTLAQW